MLSKEQIAKVIKNFYYEIGEPHEVGETAAIMWDMVLTKKILQAQLDALAATTEDEAGLTLGERNMKYKISIQIKNPPTERDHYYEEVEGKPFIIDGYEEFKFFKRMIGKIVISEVTTGQQVGDYYATDLEAKEDIQQRIQSIGVEALRKMIAENQID